MSKTGKKYTKEITQTGCTPQPIDSLIEIIWVFYFCFVTLVSLVYEMEHPQDE